MVEKRKEAVRQMFEEIAGIYDLGNHLLSLGQDFFWRRKLAIAIKNYHPLLVLDLASGTGDLAIAIGKQNPGTQIVALDFAQQMVRLGADKVKQKKLADAIFFCQADLEQMPFADESFDVASIAFGVRNLEQRDQALAEIFRVLKPGGVLAILEFSLPEAGWFAKIYRFYLGSLLPRIGKIIGGENAYFYLRDTIQEFPNPDQFSKELKTVGFLIQEVIPLSRGAVYLYLAKKPKKAQTFS